MHWVEPCLKRGVTDWKCTLQASMILERQHTPIHPCFCILHDVGRVSSKYHNRAGENAFRCKRRRLSRIRGRWVRLRYGTTISWRAGGLLLLDKLYYKFVLATCCTRICCYIACYNEPYLVQIVTSNTFGPCRLKTWHQASTATQSGSHSG